MPRIQPGALDPEAADAVGLDALEADGEFAEHVAFPAVEMVLEVFGVKNPIFLDPCSS